MTKVYKQIIFYINECDNGYSVYCTVDTNTSSRKQERKVVATDVTSLVDVINVLLREKGLTGGEKDD
jgi:hypothetical protein